MITAPPASQLRSILTAPLVPIGAVLLTATAAVTLLSRWVDVPQDPAHWPAVLGFTGIQLVAVAAYFGAVRGAGIAAPRFTAAHMIGFAVALRVVSLFSLPLFDDDLYRYIWDGKVTAHGLNPYRHAPQEVVLPPFDQLGDAAADRLAADRQMATLDRLNELWFEDNVERALFQQINYPHIPTIYPPLAQVVFAGAYLISPSSTGLITCFKLVFCVFEILAICLVVAILRQLRLNPLFGLIYAWHPLVLKEIAGTGHMESLTVALTLLAFYALLRKQWFPSFLVLALAVGSKLYPLLLLPLFIAWTFRLRGWGSVAGALLVFAGGLAALYLPFADAGSRLFGGTAAYARLWEMNAGPFALVQWLISLVTAAGAPTITRVLFGLGMMALTAVLALKTGSAQPQLVRAGLFILAGAYLLSPVQNPWYICWFLPWLCFRPRWWLLALSGSALLYYPHLALISTSTHTGGTDDWSGLLLVTAYMPVCGLFVWEIINRKRRV